jgi:hypothetical protein
MRAIPPKKAHTAQVCDSSLFGGGGAPPPPHAALETLVALMTHCGVRLGLNGGHITLALFKFVAQDGPNEDEDDAVRAACVRIRLKHGFAAGRGGLLHVTQVFIDARRPQCLRAVLQPCRVAHLRDGDVFALL